ncbi:MAG: cyclic nucleotide-binding domain-containing protein [Gemmataceae bacterium]
MGAVINITIDGKPLSAPATKTLYNNVTKKDDVLPTTIYDVATQAGIDIPILCHREHNNPVAVCRACVVDVGGRVLAPACYRPIEEGMKVQTAATSPRVRTAVKTVTELLLADHPTPCAKHREYHDCELEVLAEKLGIKESRFPRAPERRPHDNSSLVIAVDHNACILCDRCIRGCNEVRDNQVLGRMGKGYNARIAFDLDAPMGNSTCVACGECMVSCPTGALTNLTVVKLKPGPGIVSADELAKHPLFEGISHPFLRFNEGAVIRRKYQAGDIVCREGEFGSTAFLIEEGTLSVLIETPFKHFNKKAKDRGLFGLVRRAASGLVGRNEDRRAEESTTRYIHIDAPVSLDYSNPIAKLTPQDLIFGEMTCMSSYPRSATVRAETDCTLLEMQRNVLYMLQRSKKSRAILDQVYRDRAISSHLRSVPIFAEQFTEEKQFDEFVDFLRPRVDLVRINPGETIFHQGDPADGFYLVRVGFVKVAQNQPGGEHVLTYIGPGGYFGEIGLMAHLPEIRALAPRGIRTATCSALDHVDVVRISAEDFRAILNRFPAVRERFTRAAVERLEQNERDRRKVENVPLGDFLSQGLMNAQSLLVLDLEKCTRCDECTKACSDSHDGVTRLVREGLRFDKYLVASSCRSCLDPYCMVGCPVGSIRRRNSREIIIEDWCIGCGKCAENCPYGNINMHPFEEWRPNPETGKKVAVMQQKATMCDLCVSLDGQPSCVYACPHDAAHRYSGQELLNLVARDRSF